MDKKYLVFGLVCLVIGFGSGLLGGLMIAGSDGVAYRFNQSFDSSGFKMLATKEVSAQIKEIKDAAVIVSFAVASDSNDRRAKNTTDKEIKINEQTQIFVKSLKTDADRYGVDGAKKIADLEEQRKKLSPRDGGNKYAKFSEQISAIKRAASDSLSAKVRKLSAKIEVLKVEEVSQLAELNAQLQALLVDYTLTPIKLTDLKVGETVVVSSEKGIDLEAEIVASRLVVSR